ncbi:MAG: orotate phosphoribosyltransferase, partial [Cryomorphaceae bacterium]|nr:orotate phosphoribosyltransferase [Cryomorphaceae bacterium]
NVVVIEDLISTGKSSLNAINALKSEGYNVMGMLSIFSYNFQFANKKFEDENILINSLSDYNSLVEIIESKGSLDNLEISRLKKWREDPKTWS